MIRILLICPVRFYRDGLAELLRQHDRFLVVGAAVNSREASEQLRNLKPDVVLVDHAMVGSCVLARELAVRCRVVILGISGLPDDVVKWTEAGISGYVDVDDSVADLIQVVESAWRGEFVCPATVVARIVQRVGILAASEARADPALGELTSREREILELIARGMSNKAISKQLGITQATTKNHVHNLLQKLHVSRRGEAAAVVRSFTQP